MTMQIAMIGTDGIVLASDTKWSAQNESTRHTYSRSKIIISRERPIAVSFARNMESSEKAAQMIANELSNEEWKSPKDRIEKLAEKALLATPYNRSDINCLIVSGVSRLRLFVLEMMADMSKGPQPVPTCWEMTDKGLAGDTVNPAVFWSERYYGPRPIYELLPIAAQVIVSAGKLGPDRISGLEAIVCDASSCRRLSAESIKKLQSLADANDERMGTSFAAHNYVFTYD